MTVTNAQLDVTREARERIFNLWNEFLDYLALDELPVNAINIEAFRAWAAERGELPLGRTGRIETWLSNADYYTPFIDEVLLGRALQFDYHSYRHLSADEALEMHRTLAVEDDPFEVVEIAEARADERARNARRARLDEWPVEARMQLAFKVRKVREQMEEAA